MKKKIKIANFYIRGITLSFNIFFFNQTYAFFIKVFNFIKTLKNYHNNFKLLFEHFCIKSNCEKTNFINYRF